MNPVVRLLPLVSLVACSQTDYPTATVVQRASDPRPAAPVVAGGEVAARYVLAHLNGGPLPKWSPIGAGHWDYGQPEPELIGATLTLLVNGTYSWTWFHGIARSGVPSIAQEFCGTYTSREMDASIRLSAT